VVAVQWRGRATTRVVGVGLMSVVALGALGACSGRPGAAAVVDGRTISVSDLHTVMTELGPYFQDSSTSGVLEAIVQERPMIDVAAEKGVGASDEDAQKLLDQIAQQAGAATTPTFSPASVEVARASVSLSNLQGLSDSDEALAELSKRIGALDVTVNPRFGSVGDANAVEAATPRPWLVSSSAGSAGSPSTESPTPGATEPAATPSPTSTP
jgi:hypothetical protein